MKRVAAAVLVLIFLICGPSVFAEGASRNQWCLELINAENLPEAGESDVRVALIDSGVREEDSRIDGEKILEGKNYVFPGEDTDDRIGHGTAVASIIMGASSETQDIAAITGNVSIIPLVCFSRYISGVPANSGMEGICRAIYDAVDIYGCRIINLSSGIHEESPELLEAVEYAEKIGVIIVSAVGNSNQYAPERIFYPAACRTVVGVGSVNSEGEVSAFSQRNTSVLVTAPGENVEALLPYSGEKFKSISGTSYAAAYVTAYAARTLSLDPDMTPGEFRQILKTSSRDMGDPGYDTSYGWGIIDVKAGFSEDTRSAASQ